MIVHEINLIDSWQPHTGHSARVVGLDPQPLTQAEQPQPGTREGRSRERQLTAVVEKQRAGVRVGVEGRYGALHALHATGLNPPAAGQSHNRR